MKWTGPMWQMLGSLAENRQVALIEIQNRDTGFVTHRAEWKIRGKPGHPTHDRASSATLIALSDRGLLRWVDSRKMVTDREAQTQRRYRISAKGTRLWDSRRAEQQKPAHEGEEEKKGNVK